MKNLVLLTAILILVSIACNTTKENKKSVDEIKKMSSLYHERNLEDVDMLLDDDFIGSFYRQNESIPTTWDKEGHKNAISNYPNINDSILVQVAEDDWVAEHYIRTFINEGTVRKVEVMQFKQFKNGKIIRSWELFSSPLEND